MKNLTELLKDIPLEEMTGGLDMNFSEENNTKINVQNSKAKIKNKAPAAIAIAACAAVAVAGAMHYRGNDIPEPGNKQDSSTVTTDAEDTAVKERSPEEELNYELAKRFFEDIDMDITTMGDGLHIMNSKLGTVTEGFDDYDLWVPGVLVNGSEYSVLVAMQTKDGSDFPKDMEDIDYKGDIVIDGYMLSGGSEGFSMHIYGDKAIGMQTVDLDNTVYKEAYDPYEDHPDASEVLNADSTVHFEVNYLYMDMYDDPLEGVFTAEFKLGDVFSGNSSSEISNEEKQKNEEFARMIYESKGYDYELVKDYVVLMDSKVGETKDGFEDFDIRLSDVRYCYPICKIDIAVQTKDGSVLDDEQLECLSLELYAGDKSLSDYIDIEKTVSKDKAVFTVSFDSESAIYGDDYEENDDEDEMRLRVILDTLKKGDTTYKGRFEAEITEEQIMDNIEYLFPEIGFKADEIGKWDFHDGSGTEPEYLNYSVKELEISNCQLMLSIFGDTDSDELKSDLEKALKLQLNDSSYEAERDIDFIKLEYDDGTIESLNFSNMHFMNTDDVDNKKGCFVIINSIDTPFDSLKVKAVHVGSAVIKTPKEK
ncbi:hypothetical protein [Ruminococcus albus]|uniref:DUF4179 domain-containing protein n=1 Tax=Ruminococcus albus TaxID=1264 RepID=A0A1H7K671_RUMAL|nr:hypothetical protein [Ruminococcus albus]SEK82381.1 hypothetical protein SAMN05216469_10684 [Ruminococcus albus]